MTVSSRVLPTLLALSLTAAAGCGDTESPPDAPPVVSIDGAMACNPTGVFGNLRAVGGLDSAHEDEFASLSADELTVYLADNSAAPGTANLDLYAASRPTIAAPFGAPVSLVGLNTSSDDRSPSVSSDGLSLFFHSSRGTSYDLYVSTRTSTGSSFGAPTALGPSINSTFIETSPVVSADGKTLYFDRDDGTGSRLFRSTLGPTGFQAPTPVSELDTASAHSATLTADELTIFFASDRVGGAGMIDIWTATRASTQVSFGAITNVTELNTNLQEFPDWVSPDGCRLYFTSNRPGGAGGFDIFVAERAR